MPIVVTTDKNDNQHVQLNLRKRLNLIGTFRLPIERFCHLSSNSNPRITPTILATIWIQTCNFSLTMPRHSATTLRRRVLHVCSTETLGRGFHLTTQRCHGHFVTALLALLGLLKIVWITIPASWSKTGPCCHPSWLTSVVTSRILDTFRIFEMQP